MNVGDIVYLSIHSRFFYPNDSFDLHSINPIGIKGVITRYFKEDRTDILNVTVRWINTQENSFKDEDLIVIKNKQDEINYQIEILKYQLDREDIVIEIKTSEEKNKYIKLQQNLFKDSRFNDITKYDFSIKTITGYPYGYIDKEKKLYGSFYGFTRNNRNRQIINFSDIIKPLEDLIK